MLHFVLTLFTAGLWLITWLFILLTNQQKRVHVTVQDDGYLVRRVLPNIASGPPPCTGQSPAAPPVQASDPEERLERLNRLREAGTITDEEYSQRRKAIIDEL